MLGATTPVKLVFDGLAQTQNSDLEVKSGQVEVRPLSFPLVESGADVVHLCAVKGEILGFYGISWKVLTWPVSLVFLPMRVFGTSWYIVLRGKHLIMSWSSK